MKETFEVNNWAEVEEYEDIKVFSHTKADIKRQAFLKKKWAREREEQKQRRKEWRMAQ